MIRYELTNDFTYRLRTSSSSTRTLGDGETVHVVTDGECERDKMVNDLIQVNKRHYLSITNDVNVYA